jgi:5'-deoxynucleotidase YfbR-like HD superfamily hydrolase
MTQQWPEVVRTVLTRDGMMTSRALAARVKRYHTWPTHHQQTVAEHCARVGTLYVEVFGLPRAEVLYRILHHDSGEFFAGDPPFPVKRKYPQMQRGHAEAEAEGLRTLGVELPDLAAHEVRRVKVADLLEMHEFGVVELSMGNRYAEPIVRDTWTATQSYARENLPREDVVKINDWMAINGVELT